MNQNSMQSQTKWFENDNSNCIECGNSYVVSELQRGLVIDTPFKSIAVHYFCNFCSVDLYIMCKSFRSDFLGVSSLVCRFRNQSFARCTLTYHFIVGSRNRLMSPFVIAISAKSLHIPFRLCSLEFHSHIFLIILLIGHQWSRISWWMTRNPYLLRIRR